jgi:hypothetical protein
VDACPRPIRYCALLKRALSPVIQSGVDGLLLAQPDSSESVNANAAKAASFMFISWGIVYQVLHQAGIAHFSGCRCGIAEAVIACVSVINTAGRSSV